MEMDGRDDAVECRDRCLQAVADTDEIEVAQALWRAAKRYNERNRLAAGALGESIAGRRCALDAGVTPGAGFGNV